MLLARVSADLAAAFRADPALMVEHYAPALAWSGFRLDRRHIEARVEWRPDGHRPHYDGRRMDGAPPNKPWCACTLSLLLSAPDEFHGGRLVVNGQPLAPEEHHHRAVVLGPDDLHAVEPHTGRREVVLAFLSGSWGG